MKDKIVEILKLYQDPAEDLNHHERGTALFSHLYETVAEEIDQLYSAGEEVSDELETKLLDAINAGLRKWGFKDKLSFEDGFDLLNCLQDQILKVKLTHPTVLEEEIHPVKFGRWLLKYATPHYNEEGLACWLYGTVEYDTHELYERFKELLNRTD